MKKFPRIYSLSTLGLIHHQEFDYLFHAFRTDFIGESGSGKSMIADLVQLIFVGSEAFESATRATDTRDPQGMVLQTETRGKGVGYAFLNIELRPGQYLVAGAYMETGNRNTQSFIVQAGYDWSKIEYLTAPISFKQFLNSDEILSMDLLPDWLHNHGLHIKSWQRPKEYHKILFREKIVPLDLASNDRLLKDYAGILQSFSRGKMLDTQNGESLKLFLFGDLEPKRILEQFRNAEKDMSQAIGEYGSNQQEIDRVTQKQRALLELRELKAELDKHRHTYLYTALLYAYQEWMKVDNEVRECVTDYRSASQQLAILRELLHEKINEVSTQLPTLQQKHNEAEAAYEAILPRFKLAEGVSEWLGKFGCSYEELEERYRTYKQDRAQKAALQPFIDVLRQKRLEEVFEKIPNKAYVTDLNLYLSDKIKESQEVLSKKKQLKQYANINEPSSLAFWALEQKRAFSREEESAILSFQELPRAKTIDHNDYLPNPAELILALSIIEIEQAGFWITLNGIRRYISYVEEQILDSTEESKIRSYFDTYTMSLDNDILQLETMLEEYQLLQKILSGLDNGSLILSAYHRKEVLDKLPDIPSLNISEERFNEFCHAYSARQEVQKLFQQAKENKISASNELSGEADRLNEYKLLLGSMLTPNIDDAAQTIIDEIEKGELLPYQDEKENLSANLSRSANKTSYLKQQLQSIQHKLENILKIKDLKARFDTAENDLRRAKENYLAWNQHLPETLISAKYIQGVKDEHEQFFKSETKYTERYSVVIDQYIASESYRLQGTTDFVELAKHLLPEAFHGAIVEQSEAGIVDAIAAYLTRINDRNRLLNNRKIQKIKDLLDELDEMTTQQENTIRLIENFLKSGAQITGGYTAHLRKGPAVNYPKSWMSTFKGFLEDEQQAGRIQTRLGEKVDLEGMIKEAFLSSGGPTSAVLTPAKLLNPSSYYELSFKMESESGRINKGSTGQTYAAIALLCIARLSIMSNDDSRAIEPAVRVMPIDEAEGLGANYDMLYDIALKYDYQLISLSIGPVGKFRDGEQHLYMLHKNTEVEEPVNYPPIAILRNTDKTQTELLDE